MVFASLKFQLRFQLLKKTFSVIHTETSELMYILESNIAKNEDICILVPDLPLTHVYTVESYNLWAWASLNENKNLSYS